MATTNVNTTRTVRTVHMPVAAEDYRQVCVEKHAMENLVLLVGTVEQTIICFAATIISVEVP